MVEQNRNITTRFNSHLSLSNRLLSEGHHGLPVSAFGTSRCNSAGDLSRFRGYKAINSITQNNEIRLETHKNTKTKSQAKRT